MGDPLGSYRVNSQKQNSEGVVGAQSGQYHATMESSPGCDGGPGGDMTWCVLQYGVELEEKGMEETEANIKLFLKIAKEFMLKLNTES
ncbi:hypothetical protein TB2_029013 [Malus domestica]